MESAEVVVIGGGVIGASIAWHLASRGCRDVVVLDRESGAGLGSTGKATGGFRAQFGSVANIGLSLLAREKLRRFRDDTGVDSGYWPCGYLFLADDPATLQGLREAQALQHACGLAEARMVSPDEAAELNPAISTEGLAGGSWCPSDGFIRPLEMLRGYTEAAQRLGVRFEYDAQVTGVAVRAGRAISVTTSRTTLLAGAVVNAAGAWAGVVAEMAGVALPVVPLRRQIAPTVPTQVLPAEMPLTIFIDDGFHTRVRDGRVLLLWPDEPRVDDPFATAFDPAWLRPVEARARRRIPVLRQVPVDRSACWAGLYEMSPDRHVILGASAEVENFYLANGSSGHGVMHSPALGQLLAEIMVDGKARSLDVSALRLSRFAEGEPVAGPDFL